MTEYRASFDAEITFRNGGGLQTQGFRLDVPHARVDERAVAELLVRHLGLLMVDEVRLTGLRVFEEAHKGSRGGPSVAAAGGHRLVDLSHPIEAGMITYPGLPGPAIERHLSREDSRGHYAPGTTFTIDRITMVGNTGTYLDSPFHRYADGEDLADLELTALAALPIALIDVAGSAERAITPTALQATEVEGHAVVLRTGWDVHWRTEQYGVDAPYLDGAAAQWLVRNGARLVGIDSANIDDPADGTRPAHSTLLAAGIPVLEHLTGLGAVPVTGARLHAVPPKVRSFGSFPVRAYAVVGPPGQ